MVARLSQQTGKKEILVYDARSVMSHRYRFRGGWFVASGWSQEWRACPRPQDVESELLNRLAQPLVYSQQTGGSAA